MLQGILDGARRELVGDVRRRLGELRVALVRAGARDDEQKALGRSITQLDELFLLVVVGEFNAGKSAVINALLGEQVLEEGVVPTTTRVEVLRHGEERTRTPCGGGYEEITLPLAVLREMSIVDTPGTNAVLRGHEALTREFVPRSDLVLFVTSADRPFTESERAFLETIRDWGKKVVVAVNKTDILDRPADVDKVVDFVRSNLRELLGLRPEVFPVSARRAQRARAAGTEPHPTGLRPLEEYLTRTLDQTERLRIKLASPVGVSLSVLDRLAGSAKERLAVVEADEAALREVDGLLVLHLQEQSRDFRLRLAEVETPLAALERRGASFLERTLRVARTAALFDGDAVASAFRGEVATGFAAAIDARVEGVVDAVVSGEARLWSEVVERLKRRRAVHGQRMAEPKLPPVNRARPLELLQRECRRALDGYDAAMQARQLAGTARWAAMATLLLPLAGLLVAGATVTRMARGGGATGAVAGIVAAVALVAAGLLPIPALLRREKSRLAQGADVARQRLAAALRAGFERELQGGQKRVKESVAPFAALVRGAGEQARGLSAEIEARRREFAALRARIESLR